MTILENRIEYFAKKYRRLLIYLKSMEKKHPDGSLQVRKVKRGYEYYHYLNGKKKYLSKKDTDLVRRLVRKEYFQKLIYKVSNNLKVLEKLQVNFKEKELDNIFDNLHEGKKPFINPIEKTWAMKLNSWLNDEHSKKGFNDDMIVIKTKNGIRVRSKSEKILGDYFHEKGLIFQYEKPVIIDEYTTFHPDFAFLSPKNNEEIYWEHFGMMDKPEYSSKVYSKILKYRNCGIYVGVNLIVTIENSKEFIDMKEIDALIKQFLLDN